MNKAQHHLSFLLISHIKKYKGLAIRFWTLQNKPLASQTAAIR
jgi:hypothetical protein